MSGLPVPKQPKRSKSRKRLPAVSETRRSQAALRDATRAAVILRAGNRCEYAAVIPEIPCAFYGGRGLECDEIRGGSYRVTEWLDPERIRLSCPAHHDFKTTNKREVIRRLENP